MIKENVKIDHKNLISILQSCLVLILVILAALMMVEIGNLKGTARVINYAGLVRGDTQRAVKLEITGTRNDELIAYLDDILSDLTSGDGHYELVKLKDAAYQDRLDIQRAYWERLKAEVAVARQRGYENTQIVAMSETYFEMADETVSAAEHYSEKIAMKIRTIEILSALDMLCLVILVMLQTAMALKMARKNQLLEQKAYIDIHTGLPNKGSCEELLNNREILREPTACVIFDLNNLKTVNDTMGHSAGDQLILSFARLLRRVIPEKHFVGRYGGDEFMAVIYHTDRQEVEGILDTVCAGKPTLQTVTAISFLSATPTVGRSPPIMKAASCKRCWTRPTIACTKISGPTTSFQAALWTLCRTVWTASTARWTTLQRSLNSAVEWGCTSVRCALQAAPSAAFKGRRAVLSAGSGWSTTPPWRWISWGCGKALWRFT